MKIKCLLLVTLISYLLLASCSPTRNVSKISYQSFRTTFAQPDKEHPIPEEAEIVLMYDISDRGDVNVIVYNRTDEIMTIDQTKSFFVSSNGKSQSYFDPTIRTISQTNSSSTSRGASVNLGSVANLFGVGGTVGSLLSGVNVGGGNTQGTSVTEVTQMADQPTVSLAPRSYAAMSKTFNEPMVGRDVISTNIEMTDKTTHCKFSFCISYSLDGGVSYKKLVTDIYSNSRIVVPVSENDQLNDAFREIYRMKPDAIYEPFYQLIFDDNIDEIDGIYNNGVLFDFQ